MHRSLLDLFRKVFNDATFMVWVPRIMGGDTDTVLDDRVKQLNDTINETRKDAQTSWQKFDELRTELAGSDEDVTNTESEGFQRAEEAHREYATKADELAALEARRDQLWAMTAERGTTEPGSSERQRNDRIKDGLASRESFGARVIASEEYQAAVESGLFQSSQRIGGLKLGEMMTRDEFEAHLKGNAEMHALITGADDTSAGAFITPDDLGFRAVPERPLVVTDLITVGGTDSDSVEYVKETGFTNAAAPVAEATDVAGASGEKPQSTIAYVRDSEPVKTIAHWIAATRRSLADAAQLRTRIDGRLRYGLARVLEDQILDGTGVGENFLGIYRTTGVQTQAKGADPLVDAIHKAITKLRLAFFEPTAVGIDPLDWEVIRLSKDANGQYHYGPPALAGPMTIWGQPAVVQAHFIAGNPLIGDFRLAELYIREGVQVLASDSHADFFIRNLVALLAEMRAAFIVPVPEGFCEVTS